MDKMTIKEQIVNQLKEMGFCETKIDRALKETKAETIEQVMEWIIAHDEEPGRSSGQEREASTPEPADGQSMPVDETQVEEGSDGKPKSAEELELEKKRYEELIKQRRLEREEKERREAILKEKSRRKTGGEIAKLREKMEAEEKMRVAQELRKEKLEREAHKKAILEQIKRDREAMKQQSQPSKPEAPAAVSFPKSASAQQSGSKSSYDTCKIAIRLPNGQQLQQEFSANEQLSAVRLFIQMNRKDIPDPQTSQFNLLLPPGKNFSEEDMEKTLQQLGLCPSARLIVSNSKARLS